MKGMKLVAKNVTTEAADEFINTYIPFNGGYSTGDTRTFTTHYFLDSIKLAAVTHNFRTDTCNIYLAK